jgi:hypothetical protein
MAKKAAKKTAKKRTRKKKIPDVEGINLPPLVDNLVIASRLGRALASHGAKLTNYEKVASELAYYSLRANKTIGVRAPSTIEMTDAKLDKKYTPKEAIQWFADNFPKEAQPLLNRVNETHDQREKGLNYGLKPGRDYSDEQYISVLTEIADIPNRQAKWLYLRVLKPLLQAEREKEGLVAKTIEKIK